VSTHVIIVEKMTTGELRTLDEREWNDSLLSSLNHANYLILNELEYEMIEGRIHVERGTMELLVIAAPKS
jgi:hypothetical protein